MDIKIPAPSCSVTIGDEFQATNKIEFKLELSAKTKESVVLTLQIPVSDTGLLRQDSDANKLSIGVTRKSDKPAAGAKAHAESLKSAPATSKEGFKSYYLGSGQGFAVHGVVEYLVSIGKILCNAKVGDAKIEVQAINPDINPNRKDTDPPNPDRPKITGNVITVTQKQPTPSEVKNPILYFIAKPSFVIGQGEVELSWSVVSPKKIKLSTPSNPSGEYVTSDSSRKDYLRDNTFTYKLDIEGHKEYQRETTVNVVAKPGNWTEITPEKSTSTFPSVIFYPQRTDEALYIINCGLEAETTVTRGLYESADGITNWTLIDEAVPKGMESSPGLKLRNRLWLIGGSSVDPDQKSDQIWYFDKDTKVWDSVELNCRDATDRPHRAVYRSGGGFEKRMGHACVAIDEDRFWVVGGLGEFEALNDVWEFTIEEPKDRKSLSKIEALKLQDSKPNMPCWTPRCMFSAFYFSDSDAIWVCGGLDSPHGKAAGDIWTCGLPKKRGEGPLWTPRKWSDVKNSVGTGADVCGESIFLVVQNREGDEQAPDKWNWASTTLQVHTQLAIGSSISFGKKLGPPLPSTWCEMPHSLTLVGFKERLHLRCLHRNAMYGGPVRKAGDRGVGAPLFVYIPLP
ncbi:MAG: kelch repeat-containing protein [Bryobacteraceae bacterium]